MTFINLSTLLIIIQNRSIPFHDEKQIWWMTVTFGESNNKLLMFSFLSFREIPEQRKLYRFHEGIFQPSWCHLSKENCAVALTAFPSKFRCFLASSKSNPNLLFSWGHTDLFNTGEVLRQIIQDEMYVVVLFLGDNLDLALESLETDRRRRQGKSSNYPLVIHYDPSSITVKYNLSQVERKFHFLFQIKFKVIQFCLVFHSIILHVLLKF